MTAPLAKPAGPTGAPPPTLPEPDPGPALSPRPGVIFTPSSQISASLKRQVQVELERLPRGSRAVMARVDVSTAAGLNAVVAYQTASGWQAGLWVGKSGWDQVAGVSVAKTW